MQHFANNEQTIITNTFRPKSNTNLRNNDAIWENYFTVLEGILSETLSQQI